MSIVLVDTCDRLNLGSADALLPPPWWNVDLADFSRDGFWCQRADLTRAWPWPESSVTEVRAHDIIEHLPDRIFTMNELWRVLVPGGRADILVPNASRGAGFYQDPTHCSAWCRNSFQYFEHGSHATQRLADAYGIRARFKVLTLEDQKAPDKYEEVWKVHAVLEAVK